MSLRIQTLLTAFLIASVGAAEAGPTAEKSLFAAGIAVNGTGPNSITIGGGSVWVEYGNGGDQPALLDRARLRNTA